MDHYRAVLDVNLYGMISVTKAFLPQIRNNKGKLSHWILKFESKIDLDGKES